MPSWQAKLAEAARAARERDADRPPIWEVRAIDPPEISMVWAVRYTRAMLEDGVRVAEDLSLAAACYEYHVVVDHRMCEDGIHALFEFRPPVESLHVRADGMTGVVSALRRSGYHGVCSDGRGTTYEF